MSVLKMIQTESKIIPMIQKAITESLKGYTNSDVVAKPAFFKSEKNQHDLKLVGMLRLTGKEQNAILALCFSEQMFFKIYENMFQEKLSSVNADNQDLVGELANIVFQTIDPELQKMGHNFIASLPEVLTGEKLNDWSAKISETSLVMPFSLGSDEFFFKLIEIEGE